MNNISGVWGWVPFVGGLVLAALLLWAMLGNRRSRGGIERTERETRALRDRLDREGEDAQKPR